MPRTARKIVGGYAYHVLNRANGRLRLFRKDADFAAFVVMGNHWHFVVWPHRAQGEQVSAFFRWLTITHAQRWHAHHATAGMGHVYQGRFKSFPVASDEHLLAVLRYVERNPLRAQLVDRAEAWRWGSLYRRQHGTPEEQALLCEPPVALGRNWTNHVNRPQNAAELRAIEESLRRGRPYGSQPWQQKMAKLLGLEYTFRPRGRPRKAADEDAS
jgi:putative transposase